jgi:hypothetical protein
MTRSAYFAPILALTVALAGCAARNPAPPAERGGGVLTVATGVPIVARFPMPPGFEPIAFRPPLWLSNGRDLAVVGSFHGNTTLLGVGLGRPEPIVLAADHPPESPNATLADIAASPDHSSLAIAVTGAAPNRIDVFRYDLANGSRDPIASIETGFESVSLGWPLADTLALAIRPDPAAAGALGAGAGLVLYLIPANGPGPRARLPFDCAFTPLSWSPGGAYAVGQGDTGTQPVLIDLEKKTCLPLNVPGPITVLQWSSRGTSFIYAGPTPGNPIESVFQFDIPTGRADSIAISSSAAAYVSDNSILALGNRQLALPRVLANPQTLVTAEVALLTPAQGSIRIETLGVPTLPEMMASSTMTYSARSQMGAIELFAPSGLTALRHLVVFSISTGREVLLASGPAIGLSLMSWSPDGQALAVFDGDVHGSELLVIAPQAARGGPPSGVTFVPPR